MSRRPSFDLGLAGASDMTAAEAARYEHMPHCEVTIRVAEQRLWVS
jgi:hypothetical protein